jgi:hypothetical protein
MGLDLVVYVEAERVSDGLRQQGGSHGVVIGPCKSRECHGLPLEVRPARGLKLVI